MKRVLWIAFGVLLYTSGFVYAKEVTTDSFDKDVLKSKAPILVEFYRDGCGWCKKSEPIVAEFEKKNSLAKIDVIKEHALVEKLGVPDSTPFYVKFQDGKEVGRWAGYSDLKTLQERFDDPSKAPKPKRSSENVIQLQARGYQLIQELRQIEMKLQQLQQPQKDA
jgi:thioredoxin 1